MKVSVVKLIIICSVLLLITTVAQIIFTLSPVNKIKEEELNLKPIPNTLNKKLILDLGSRSSEYK